MKQKTRKKLWIAIGAVVAAIAVFFIYVGTYSRALPEAQAVADGMENVDGDLTLRAPGDTGIILYPGGKVDEAAYAPLASMLHEGGYTVVIAKMPFHLAIFSPNRAQEIMEKNPDITSWVIAGHSLGGTAASMYAADYPATVMGIVFMGSYPYEDLSETSMAALCIYASGDEVLNWEKASEAEPFYPESSSFETIEGGNHAGFGCYGAQRGDGQASIGWRQQNEQAAAFILSMADGLRASA